VNGRSTFGSPCQHCFIISAKWGTQVSGIGGRYITDNKEKLLVLLCTKSSLLPSIGATPLTVCKIKGGRKENTAKHCNYYIVSIVVLVTVKIQPNVTHHAIQDPLKQCKLNNIRKWFFPCQNLPKEYSKRVHITCFWGWVLSDHLWNIILCNGLPYTIVSIETGYPCKYLRSLMYVWEADFAMWLKYNNRISCDASLNITNAILYT